MVHPLFQSWRSALHFHSHIHAASFRHTTLSSAADPSNVVTVKKPICHRLFHLQAGPAQSQNSPLKETPVSVPFYVYAGLNNRIACRIQHKPVAVNVSVFTRNRFSLLAGEPDGPEEEETYGARPHCLSRSIPCNALFAIQASTSHENLLSDTEHEEKDNDHIIVSKAIRRKSLIGKLQPIDTYQSFDHTDAVHSSIEQSDNQISLINEWQFEPTTVNSHSITTSEQRIEVSQSFFTESDDVQYSTQASFETVVASYDAVFSTVVNPSTIDALFADPPVNQTHNQLSANQHSDASAEVSKYPLYPGCTYSGALVNGLAEGHGELWYANGDRYNGWFHAGCPSGSGIFTWVGRGQYQGQLLGGQPHGRGTLFSLDGDCLYQGQWEHGSRHGAGTSFVNGRVDYNGSWQNNRRHGRGVAYLADQTRYEGEWMNDLAHGFGKVFVHDTQQLIHAGEWRNGEIVQIRESVKLVAVPTDQLNNMQKQLDDISAALGRGRADMSLTGQLVSPVAIAC